MTDIKRQFDGFSSMMTGLKSVLGGLALSALGKQAIDVMSSFEQLEIRLNSVMGSATKGQEAFAWIKQFAKDTPFEVDQVTQSFMLLKNMGIDPMGGAMKSIADRAAQTGGGFETLQRISLALGQAWTKSKLQGEEAMQLLEAGVPVWDMLSKVLGKTTAEVQELSSKGRLGRDVLKALIDEMGRSSAGAAEAQMKSLAGQISNLADNAKGAADELRRAGGLDPFKEAISGLNTEFDRLEKNGTINRWAHGIADAMREIASNTREALDAVSDAANRIAGDIGKATDAVAKDVDGVSVVTQTMATIITEASYFVQTAWASLAGAVRDVRAVIVTAWESITLAVKTAREFISGHIEVLVGWFRILGNVAGAVLRGDFSGAATAWDSGLKQIQSIVANRTANIAKQAKDAQKSVADVWKNSGMMTSGTELNQIQKQRDQRIQRIFAPTASYSNEGRIPPAEAAKPKTTPTKPPKLLDEKEKKKRKPKEESRLSEWNNELDSKRLDAEMAGNKLSAQAEADFWQQKLALTKANSKEREQVVRQHTHALLAIQREGDRNAKELEQAQMDARRQAQDTALQIDEAAYQREAEMLGLSADEQEATLIAFEQRRLEIKQSFLDQRIAALERDPDHNIAEVYRLQQEREQAEIQHQARLAEIRGASAKPGYDRWQGAEDDTSSMYEDGLQRMLQGTLSFKQAIQGVWAEIGRIMVQNLVLRPAAELAGKYTREIAQESAHHAALFAIEQGWLTKKLAIKLGLIKADAAATATGETVKTGAVAAGEAARTGATATGTLARLGLKAMEAVKSIMLSAWEAMASAFKAIVGIPYVGPVLAVGAGAAAFAAVSGIASRVKSARGGYSIPRGVNPMTQLHEEEMVLPRGEAAVIRGLAGRGGGAGSGEEPASPSSVFQVTYNDHSGKLTQQDIDDNARKIMRALEKQHRNFARSKP
ncbi:hypothetical protein B0T39_09190 [Chromobacterium haemolyticum]|nr:hypothetical protein B0T39_09190 [Chromobacterium haemolyticum]